MWARGSSPAVSGRRCGHRASDLTLRVTCGRRLRERVRGSTRMPDGLPPLSARQFFYDALQLKVKAKIGMEERSLAPTHWAKRSILRQEVCGR